MLLTSCSFYSDTNQNSIGNQDINNATYYFKQFPFPPEITLSDGIAYPPAGAYTGKAYIKIVEPTVFEDLNFDNQKDAIIILEGWFGGTGVFKFLAVVINVDGEAVNIGTVDLGDEVLINLLSVENKVISINFSFNNSSDNTIRYFTVENNEIKETNAP